MIWTVIRISLSRLLHNRVELALAFIVPIAFFSIFAVIFGNGIGSGTTPRVKVVLVDQVNSLRSQKIAESLRDNNTLRCMDNPDSKTALTATRATEMVRRGSATIGIVLQPTDSGAIEADLLADTSDQVAGQVVAALVGRELVVANAPVHSNQLQSNLIKRSDQHLVRSPPMEEPRPEDAFGLVEIVDVIGEGKSNPVISMYAAGIAVMFLLFGSAGGGGVLLEERENTTLDRLLSTRLTMDQLLLGKWYYLTVLGFIQVSLMFAWGQLFFGVDLLGHLDGFIMLTLVTSGAASAFGIFLATLCKTRGQLNGLSVVLILVMSALGGSMVPRYVMSDRMRELGLWTFNAWALDGYDKVFWRDLPVSTLWPQLGVLMAAGIGFLLLARLLAVRWQFD